MTHASVPSAAYTALQTENDALREEVSQLREKLAATPEPDVRPRP